MPRGATTENALQNANATHALVGPWDTASHSIAGTPVSRSFVDGPLDVLVRGSGQDLAKADAAGYDCRYDVELTGESVDKTKPDAR